ncbi:TRAP transporter large permease [Marinobacterium mangrovicola]|uniref:TRAP transporter large permease protein n=1 Tax=Marinobacterium mangrovicola TaxID=1476959 RepID=A0A4R1GGX8_9GAMM|nr:TRAP transporter large permease subunit [Marinobacterium mangrovicola]TCK07614.1 tripartite ATP-independent transporter DctM subunit [Marinobacterium mangrovicola]
MFATNELIVIGMLVTFILLIFSGYPVAWILAGVSVVFSVGSIIAYEYFDVDTYFLTDWRIFGVMVQRVYAQMSNWVLVALPMFIFMGLMLDRSGVAEKLMRNFVNLFGRFRGGLGVAVVLIGILLAASTGIVGASVVLLAMLSLPVMLQQKYSKAFACGIVASSGTLGILIPPSIMLIIMADQLSLAVGDLFMGALIPGVMLGAMYMIYVVAISFLMPSITSANEDLPPVNAKMIIDTLKAVVPSLGLILAVLGSIFFGIATPTEAAGVGALGATLLAWMNGNLSMAVLKDVSIKTSLTTAFVFGIFLGATAFAVVMRSLGGDEFIAGLLNSIPLSPGGIVAVILLIAFIAGFFLDWLEISLILLPLVGPVVAGLGFDLTWFVVLFALALQTSFLTPPVGFSLFYLKGVAPPEITTMDIYKGVIPFILIQLTAVLMVFWWEDLVLWLPEVRYGAG